MPIAEGTVPWPDEFVQRYVAARYWQGRPLSAPLHEAAAVRPDAVALVDGELRLTYAQLLNRASAAAARLAELGLQPGDRIVVQLPNDREFVVLTLACLRAGIVPGSGCATASGSWPGLCTGSPTPTCAPPACFPDGAALTSSGISRATPRRWPGSRRGRAPAWRPRCTETVISGPQRSRPQRPCPPRHCAAASTPPPRTWGGPLTRSTTSRGVPRCAARLGAPSPRRRSRGCGYGGAAWGRP